MRSDVPRLLAGAIVGPYQLIRRVGAGSGGEVFLALDTVLQRLSAFKLLAADPGDEGRPEAIRRFLAEAATLRMLSHPDIVAFHGAGDWHGRPWLAMEWLPGHDLTRYTEPARLLPDALVLDIGIRLALALAYAHAQGVVHRDIKPGNVRIDLASGLLKIADFGVSRSNDATQTRTGVVLGSPAYMAPEQLAGAASDAGCDLYSLGVVIFELFTGRRPHESASLGELLRKVANEPAPDVRRVRPQLHVTVADLLVRQLARCPTDRYPDGYALADALARARLHTARPDVQP